MHFRMFSCILLDSSCTHSPSRETKPSSQPPDCRPEAWLLFTMVSARPSSSRSRVAEHHPLYCAHKSLGVFVTNADINWQVWDGAAAAKSLQSCLTLCNPTDGSPPGSSVHGIFQATVLEWGATAFSRDGAKDTLVSTQTLDDADASGPQTTLEPQCP